MTHAVLEAASALPDDCNIVRHIATQHSKADRRTAGGAQRPSKSAATGATVPVSHSARLIPNDWRRRKGAFEPPTRIWAICSLKLTNVHVPSKNDSHDGPKYPSGHLHEQSAVSSIPPFWQWSSQREHVPCSTTRTDEMCRAVPCREPLNGRNVVCFPLSLLRGRCALRRARVRS